MAIHFTRYKGAPIKGANQKEFIENLEKAINQDLLDDRTKAHKAVKEASISIACLLDDISVKKSADIDLLELNNDLEHVQNQITILENYFFNELLKGVNNAINNTKRS